MLNSQFIHSLSNVIPSTEVDDFVSSINRPINSFIRLNPTKGMDKIVNGSPVAWCDCGIKLDQREVFTVDPFFHAGNYYVQEASSMFIEQIFKNIIFQNSPSALKVLDLCAAPGGKSTHISSLIGNDSLLVANEVIKSRAAILKENIIKWGIGNTVVTSNDPSHFSKLPSFFDVVMVDAPCSGEGMFRKSEKARSEWSPGNVELCRGRSRRIISDIWDSLSEGGYFIYSTCTFNNIENEGNVKWVLDEFDAELVEMSLNDFGCIIKSEYGYRFHPNKVDSEGYFVAILRKTATTSKRDKKERIAPLVKDKTFDLSTWLNSSERYSAISLNGIIWAINNDWSSELAALVAKMNVLYFGIEIGELFGNKLRPAHALSLASSLNREQNTVVDLSLEDALNYLRRQSIDCSNMCEGYNIVGYHGSPIGWVKKIGNRANNLYPKESRILNL